MRTGYLATMGLALVFALIAKDFATPLAGIALFGLLDRLRNLLPNDVARTQ